MIAVHRKLQVGNQKAALTRLHDPAAPEQFRQEMSRFLLSSSARHLASKALTTQFFATAIELIERVKSAGGPRKMKKKISPTRPRTARKP